MAPTDHAVDLTRLRSGGWVATCTCGWVGTVAHDQEAAASQANGHAPNLTKDGNRSDVDDSRAQPTGAARPTRKHDRGHSEMIRLPDGTLRFRAVCSCGWKSRPVDMDYVVTRWERHIERDVEQS